MKIYNKRSNAQRAAERLATKTTQPHKIEAVEGGFIVVEIARAAMGRPTAGKRAEVLAQAEAGILPAVPDFSAATHKPFRAKLARLVELAAAGDAEGLEAIVINLTSSSPKALARYRDLAVIAIKAKRAGAN